MIKTALLLPFFFIPFFLYSQDSLKLDTVPVLKYELDTSVVPTIPIENPPPEAAVDEVQIDTVKADEEYFLRKEFTGGFTDSVRLRQLPDSTIRRLQEDESFWYANQVFRKKQEKPSKGIVAHPVFQMLLWLLIIAGFVTFLVLYLANSNIGLFRKSSSISSNEEDAVDTDDIFTINYQREIDRAVGLNNYRLAIRLMFLRLLKNLSDSNLINYKQDSTNFDYLLQLQPTKMYPEFFKLTRSYEYSWYGQFEVDKEKFAIIRTEFDNFERKVN